MSWSIWEMVRKGLEIGLRLRKKKLQTGPTPNRPPERYLGILTPVARPPLDSEERVRLLKLFFQWPGSHEYESLRRMGEGSSMLPERIVRAGTMATILFRCRGQSDRFDYFDRIVMVEALLRDAMAANGERCEPSIRDHGLETLQDDELVSLDKLYWFWHGSGDPPDDPLRAKMLQDVAVPAMLFEMETARHKLDGNTSRQAADDAAWRKRIGGSDDASHLIADGWLPFLTAIGQPDIVLWHEIISDFDEFGDDRLDAAYWILAQPECDRASAWTFLMGMMSWEVLSFELDHDKAHNSTDRRRRFEEVVSRWDSGFYRHHSLKLKGDAANGHHGLDLNALRDVYEKAAEKRGIAPLRLPQDMVIDLSSPPDDMARSQDIGLTFSEQTGLRLRAGKDWFRKDWHPGKHK